MPTPTSETTTTEEAGCTCGRCRAHAAGKFGPYSSKDFLELFGVANEPSPLEVPEELAVLGIEVDLAVDRRERAFATWQEAMVAEGTARANRSADAGSGKQAALTAASEDVAIARGVLEDEDARLSAVRASYNSLARRLSDQRVAEAYATDQAAQAAQRQARREAAATSRPRTALARIRAKVTG